MSLVRDRRGVSRDLLGIWKLKTSAAAKVGLFLIFVGVGSPCEKLKVFRKYDGIQSAHNKLPVQSEICIHVENENM